MKSAVEMLHSQRSRLNPSWFPPPRHSERGCLRRGCAVAGPAPLRFGLALRQMHVWLQLEGVSAGYVADLASSRRAARSPGSYGETRARGGRTYQRRGVLRQFSSQAPRL